MPKVNVVHSENGKFKILVNFIQHGIEYTDERLAQSEANKIRKELESVYKPR